MTFKPLLTAALVAVSLAGAPAMSLAQETPPVIAPEDVTDAQIEAFVRAAIAVEALRTEYTQKIANAETTEEADKLKAEASNVAAQLVDKAKGITSEEYLAIGAAAQNSPELTERLAAQIEVMRAQKAEFEEQQAEAAKAKDLQRAQEAQKAAEDTLRETTGGDAASE